MKLGAHLPTSKGFSAALKQAQELNLDCLQLFSKTPRQWKAKPLDAELMAKWRDEWAASGLGPLVIHDSYLINLAAPVAETLEKSIAAMIDEIERAELMGCDYLVTHCGAHLGSGEEAGVEQLASSLMQCLEKTSDAKVKIALEITAGQGTCLGGPFEHIGAVLKSLESPRLAVCFDTCHAWAAGHDLVNDLSGVMRDFDEQIGFENLALVHLNDSKGKLGSHLDRHDHLGEGELGEAALRAFINYPQFKDLPFILETPETKERIADNVATARRLSELIPIKSHSIARSPTIAQR